jgi:hypothetical protein
MASSRSTPFIASWDSWNLQDATVPLGEGVVSNAAADSFLRQRNAPAASSKSRRAWTIVGCAASLAVGGLLGSVESNQPPASAIAKSPHAPPPFVRADLQSIAPRIDSAPPRIAFAVADEPIASPRPERKSLKSHDELAAVLLERRKQLSQTGTADADVDAVAAISFDSSRRSARVIYQVENSVAEVVEYWAVRDGRWQPLED